MVEGENEWRLKYSFNRGSIETQDSRSVVGLGSLEACRDKFEGARETREHMGYTILFAHAIGPSGEKVEIFSDGVGHE